MDLYVEYLYITFSIPLVGGIAYGSTIPIGHTTSSRSIKRDAPYWNVSCYLDYVVLEFKFHTHIVRTATCCFSRIVFTIEDILYAELQCHFFGYFIIYGRIGQEVRIF